MAGVIRLILQACVVGLALAFVAVLLRPELLPGNRAAQPNGYVPAVDAASPAVVNIFTAAGMPGDPRWDGSPGLGSGVIISADGFIATNWHVVFDAGDIRVQLADGRTTRAELVGADPETELALLRIDLPDLPVVRMGRSDRLRPGEVVLAIGNSYGLAHTVTQGIVSAVGRGELGVATFENFIQTDAAINLGNSGGALINTRGELIGINTAVITAERGDVTPEGIGFAIPVNLVRGVTDQLVSHGRVIRGWLGVEPVDLGDDRRALLGLPPEIHGIELIGVAPTSPAARAGLRRGDILTRIDGQALTRSRQALNLVAGTQPGTRVSIEGLRNGDRFSTEAELAERPGL